MTFIPVIFTRDTKERVLTEKIRTYNSTLLDNLLTLSWERKKHIHKIEKVDTFIFLDLNDSELECSVLEGSRLGEEPTNNVEGFYHSLSSTHQSSFRLSRFSRHKVSES